VGNRNLLFCPLFSISKRMGLVRLKPPRELMNRS
jgi:hypothetical protein